MFLSIIVSVPNQFHLFCTVLGTRYRKLNIRSILDCHLFTQVKRKVMIPGTWAGSSFSLINICRMRSKRVSTFFWCEKERFIRLRRRRKQRLKISGQRRKQKTDYIVFVHIVFPALLSIWLFFKHLLSQTTGWSKAIALFHLVSVLHTEDTFFISRLLIVSRLIHEKAWTGQNRLDGEPSLSKLLLACLFYPSE